GGGRGGPRGRPGPAADPRRADRFILAGLAIALLPGLMSVPNGNRCITALPFAYLIVAAAAIAIADTAAAAFAGDTTQRRAAAVLLGLLVGVAGVDTYREYLGAERRPIIGLSPEATAAGA